MGKYFGTDGFRGEANVELTALHAFKIGRFLGWYYGSPLSPRHIPGKVPQIVIGKDTRRSSYMLEYALGAGIAASGADAYMMHVTTTPSVSYITRLDNFDCGVMISASHNQFSDNGIKIVNRDGEKMDDGTIALIESYLDGDLSPFGLSTPDLPLATGDRIGRTVDYAAGRNRYVGYLITLAHVSFKNLRIGLDCANGSAWMIAKSVFDALGAKTYVMGVDPDGTNINRDVGSTHIEGLRHFVMGNELDMGFAFDGDADRCLAIDENGNVITGDHILYIFGKHLKDRGDLYKNTVVTTIMSNLGLYKAFEREGIDYVKTDVGDRFVYECMAENGYRVGGEQSGHIILSKFATTGDGILTAIKLAEAVVDHKAPLSVLASGMTEFPQVLKNIKVANKDEATEDPEVLAEVERVSSELGSDGRVLLRRSGTEPVVRVMAEAPTRETCEWCVNRIIEVIAKRGHIRP